MQQPAYQVASILCYLFRMAGLLCSDCANQTNGKSCASYVYQVGYTTYARFCGLIALVTTYALLLMPEYRSQPGRACAYSVWQYNQIGNATGQLNLDGLAWVQQSEIAIVKINKRKNVGIQDMYTDTLRCKQKNMCKWKKVENRF